MPPEQADVVLLVVLWAVAGVMVLTVILPPLLHLAGLTRYRVEIEDHPGDLEPAGDDALYDDLTRQLLKLGFHPLGAYAERYQFFILHWLWVCRQRAFGSREHQTFAVLYRFVAGEPIRMAFASCFADQALLWTSNHMLEERVLSADHVKWGRLTSNLAELLPLHREAAERFAVGRQYADHTDIAVLAGCVEKQSRRYLASDKALPLTFLLLPFMLGGIFPFIMATTFGLASSAVPLAIVGEGCLYWAVHIPALLATIKRDRLADVKKAGNSSPAQK